MSRDRKKKKKFSTRGSCLHHDNLCVPTTSLDLYLLLCCFYIFLCFQLICVWTCIFLLLLLYLSCCCVTPLHHPQLFSLFQSSTVCNSKIRLHLSIYLCLSSVAAYYLCIYHSCLCIYLSIYLSGLRLFLDLRLQCAFVSLVYLSLSVLR